MKLKNSLSLFLIILLSISACGKKGPLKKPEPNKRAKFENVIDEE
jgi:predicted small lipoprotein YifL